MPTPIIVVTTPTQEYKAETTFAHELISTFDPVRASA